MNTYIMTGQLNFQTAPQTVQIIKKLNDLLDCLNSSSLFNLNPSKCALSDKFPHQLVLLEKAKSWFITLKTVSSNQKTTRPVCFDDMEWTINAMIMLFEEHKKKTEFVSMMVQQIIKKTVKKMPEKKNIRKFLCYKIKNDNNIYRFIEPCQDH